jgi:hypothetical protein
MTNPGRTSGWDIRLECTVCGFRHRKNRYEATDGGPMGHEPPATVVCHCSNCNAEAGYAEEYTNTLHFVDIASDEELNEERYCGCNQKPKRIEQQGTAI